LGIVTGLSEIAVKVEAGTGNVRPLLHEIRHALGRLARDEEGTIIDLGSLPLAPGEEVRIEEALGMGEVHATLDALGPTDIRETAYSGVWLVTHRNAANEIVARFVEVCRIPDLLRAQTADIEDSAVRLADQLGEKAERQ